MSNLPIWAQAALLRDPDTYRDTQRLRLALGLGLGVGLDYAEACEEFWLNTEVHLALAPLLSRRLWQPLALLRASIDEVAQALGEEPLPPTYTLTPETARAIKARALEWRYGSALEFADALDAGLDRDAEVYRVVSMTALRAHAGHGVDALEREAAWATCNLMWVTRENLHYLIITPRKQEVAYG
jgi:hypothetical protein